jgi:hypothetical protein
MMDGLGLDSSGSRQGQMPGCCEDGNMVSGSTKCRQFVTYVSKYWLLKIETGVLIYLQITVDPYPNCIRITFQVDSEQKT